MINPDRLKNPFSPGELVGCWNGDDVKNTIFVYVKEDIEDPWMAVVLGPEGFTKIRYVYLESI